jgi:hypothetical protein
MTDRYNALTVVLDHDIREDDAEPLINAIRCMKGVIKVKGNVADPDDYIARSQVKHELQMKLFELLK